jgi:predicted PurR-regulated permease PerM
MPHGVAIILSFLIAAIVMSGIISFILLPFLNEFNKFLANLPELVTRLKSITTLVVEQAYVVQLPANIHNLIEQTLSSAASFALDLVRRILSGIITVATQVFEMVVVPVLTYYFLKDANTLKNSAALPFPVGLRPKVRRVIDEMSNVESAYIRGQVLVSVIIGLLVFSGMYFMGVEYPLILGLLATLTETIPIVGPIIGAVPAVILAYTITPVLAVKVLVLFLVIHQLENHIIVPQIMGSTIDLHPVAIIISLLIGGQLLGIIGMMLAVPVAALLKVLLKYLWFGEE